MSKTTLDLSTLSDITDGTHTVKVKAKADGYRDSEFSNEVEYTKGSTGYPVTLVASAHTWKNHYGAPRIKLDVAPSSADDYDYTTTTDDTKHILNKAGDDLGSSVNLGNHAKLYVYSSNMQASGAYAEYRDMFFGLGKGYSNADIIEPNGITTSVYLHSEGQD